MLTIRHANLTDKRKTYEWLCLSDTAAMHMGAPDYPNSPVPTWAEFNEDFEDFYFVEKGRAKGSVMIIENDGEEIGCLCYACFHLQPGKAELDIWLKGIAYCGKGVGTKALATLVEYLEQNFGINAFIIRPSSKNHRAVSAYEKVGFKRVDKALREETVKAFLLPDFLEVYGDGDYGTEETEVLYFFK